MTVFTPVYNRAYIISNLYDSLKNQKVYDFEWVIVDDGSEDNIKDIVTNWMKTETRFPIRFIRTQNGGKHRAINRAVSIAKGEAFFIVDSDDYLTEDAIEFCLLKYREIAQDDQFAGIAGLRAHYQVKPWEIIGESPTQEYIDATNLERKKYSLQGDKAEVYKTSILKKYPFPEFENEYFLTEAVVWNAIARDGYKLRWFNKVIYLCEYLPDGLTYNSRIKFKENPKGWAYYLKMMHELQELQSYDKIFFRYFESVYPETPMEEIIERLGIGSEKGDEFEERYNAIQTEIHEFLNKKQCRQIAIYGLGDLGNRLLRYMTGLPYDIKFGIDKNLKQKVENILVLSGVEQIFEADAIIVTPKSRRKEIVKELKKSTSIPVYSLEEITNFKE